MGNLNCAGRSKAKKTQVLSELEKKAPDTVGDLKDKLNSLPNGDDNVNLEVQAQTTNEPTDASEIVSVWVCQNREVTQRKQIDLGASPSLNVLIEQIQYNFNDLKEENTLELLRDDSTWAEISVDNVNIPLTDIGIKNQSVISIETKEKAPETLPSDGTTTD